MTQEMKVSALLEMDLWMKGLGVLSLSQVNTGMKKSEEGIVYQELVGFW